MILLFIYACLKVSSRCSRIEEIMEVENYVRKNRQRFVS